MSQIWIWRFSGVENEDMFQTFIWTHHIWICKKYFLPLFSTKNARKTHNSKWGLKVDLWVLLCLVFQVLDSETCDQIPARLTAWWAYYILTILKARRPPNSNASQEKWRLKTRSIMWKKNAKEKQTSQKERKRYRKEDAEKVLHINCQFLTRIVTLCSG